MFRLFKNKFRTLKSWEIDVFRELLDQLGVEYKHYIAQLNFIEKVGVNRSDIPNLISFIYPTSFYKKFENHKVYNYILENLIIKDLHSTRNIVITLYFAHNIFLGYSSDLKDSTFEFDNKNIFYGDIKKKVWGEEGFRLIKKYLTSAELKHINRSDVYISSIEGVEHFHLKELSDGDFLGVNNNGVFFIVTHDPLEMKEITRVFACHILQFGNEPFN